MGRPRKSIEELKLTGNYRPDRHGAREGVATPVVLSNHWDSVVRYRERPTGRGSLPSKRITNNWVRNVSDEKAVANGCRFDEKRGQFVVDWIEEYCMLYEGEYAGQMLQLVDWQYEATMRLFSWVRWSDKWNRYIRRFRSASIWVPKKNKKSPTLAAWGLYLLAGDGEPGQKVFLAAKDGKQAGEIAGKHTMEMLNQSAAMMNDCTKNMTPKANHA